MSFVYSRRTLKKIKGGTIGPPLAYTLVKGENTEDI